jgi:hypothetical protein
MSLVDIVTLYDTWSDIHTTPAVLNPLVERRHPGDAMAIITCVTTPPESLDHTVNYVWNLLERIFRPMRARSRHSSAPSAVVAHTVSSKPPLRSTAPRERKQASTDAAGAPHPGGRQRARMRGLPTRAGRGRPLRHTR